MNKEETIKELKILKEDYWDDDGYGHETKQYNDTLLAIDMAIEVLEQEPCEDCVSRKRIKQIIGNITAEYDTETIHVDRLIDAIDDLPPVTPTRKKGHWTNRDSICSCCGEDKFKDLDADIWADWQPKYCPNCGARMEEE